MRYRSIFSVLFFPAVLPFFVVNAAESSSGFRVEVSAGELDRRDTVAIFDLPEAARGMTVLTDENGERVPFQVTPLGKGVVWIGELGAGEKAVFSLAGNVEGEPDEQWVETVDDARTGRLRMSVAGAPALFYQAEERPFTREDINPRIKRGGFLHPVMSPSGRVVSQSYPAQHPHHQGIWSPWTNTRFEGRNPDFWNMQGGRGKVEFVGIDEQWSGPVAGGFQARHQFVDLMPDEPKVALLETWTVQIYSVGRNSSPRREFDLEIYQECATDEPLLLPEYRYGGLGFRGRDEWIGAENTFFLTSEGVTDRHEGHGTRTRWTYVGGELNGERAGIVIMGHPDNFRAPQPVRLHPTEPFFCYAPSQLGDWAIAPDKPYRAHYRFVVIDGEPDPEEIERLWQNYANPLEVKVIPGTGS